MARAIAILLVALSLGLGWAIRGHFGHEWGACWAGAIGAIAIVAASRRRDWIERLPVLAALGGIGWAVGGMMSYGILVGHGRSPEWPIVLYGLTTLGIIGGLYGWIGGGFLGLGLESTDSHRPDWANLVTQMVAGGVLSWGLLIYQFEWMMTPPRSELWAACLGASIALGWFLYRHGYRRAFRVAAYSALGGGIGFAFGNFLQTLGAATRIDFNWWNVMEFTLGFCGGLGLAYGVFSRNWPHGLSASKTVNRVALFFLLFIVPATNLVHGFEFRKMVELGRQLAQSDPMAFATGQIVHAWLAVAVSTLIGFAVWEWFTRDPEDRSPVFAPAFLIGYCFLFLLFSHLRKGVFYAPFWNELEQHIYWICLAAIAVLCLIRQRQREPLPLVSEQPDTIRKWMGILSGIVVLLILMSVISILVRTATS